MVTSVYNFLDEAASVVWRASCNEFEKSGLDFRVCFAEFHFWRCRTLKKRLSRPSILRTSGPAKRELHSRMFWRAGFWLIFEEVGVLSICRGGPCRVLFHLPGQVFLEPSFNSQASADTLNYTTNRKSSQYIYWRRLIWLGWKNNIIEHACNCLIKFPSFVQVWLCLLNESGRRF